MNQRLRLLFAAALLTVVHDVAAASSARATAMPVLHALRRVEDDAMMSSFALGEDEAAYPQRRVLQSGGSISYGALAANKATCYGPCPAQGQPYTGGGCQQIYKCRG